MAALIGISLLALAGRVMSGVTSEQSEVAYQNDDYRVPPPDRSPPPLPLPETYEQATALITRNPVYDQMAPLPVRCNSQPINVHTASDAATSTAAARNTRLPVPFIRSLLISAG